MRPPLRRCAHLLRCAGLGAILTTSLPGSFRDDFERPIRRDPSGAQGWDFLTGDGFATVDFQASDGIATMRVDATKDRRNIWWAIVKRRVSPTLDLAKLAEPGTELRVEARIRPSHAPRRINVSFNTQRTTDYHTNLMEFDLGQAGVWHTISFTTQDFDAGPNDHVNAQLALMDWGLGRYELDIDYFKVEVVDLAAAGPDLGTPVPYRPPVADPQKFRHALAAAQHATVDRQEPDANLGDWSALEGSGATPILSVNGSACTILRWDLRAFAGKRVATSGLLELHTHSVRGPAVHRKDFGEIRVVEILGGDPAWDRRSVTYESLTQGRAYEEVFNTQMIADTAINPMRGSRTLITLSRPAMQRLLDGRTKGIALLPLGSVEAAFLREGDRAPTLRLNLAD